MFRFLMGFIVMRCWRFAIFKEPSIKSLQTNSSLISEVVSPQFVAINFEPPRRQVRQELFFTIKNWRPWRLGGLDYFFNSYPVCLRRNWLLLQIFIFSYLSLDEHLADY